MHAVNTHSLHLISWVGAALLSSMQFTHYTPGRTTSSTECSTGKTLQIISIQLTQLAHGLDFPLSVYGVVAVRDIVDRNRNVLFFRSRDKAQELKHNVCVLLHHHLPFWYILINSTLLTELMMICLIAG